MKKKLFITILSMLVLIISWCTQVKADDMKSYTQPFQNSTQTLSGKSVSDNTYFTKIDYWDVKKATLNLSYQVSQIADDQTSDITVSINGVKFYSFRPEIKDGVQTKQIDIPLNLIKGANNLKIYGQILNKSDKSTVSVQTPANWLTIYEESNVNFQYNLKQPDYYLKSFYNHFSGADTISFGQSVIAVPQQPSDAELSAATYALTGVTRTIATDTDKVRILPYNDGRVKDADYRVIIAKYDNLPKNYKSKFSVDKLKNRGCLRLVYSKNKYTLIITALDDEMLQKATRFIANTELMTETKKPVKYVSSKTATYMSSLHYDGSYQLTNQGATLTGSGHHEETFFVALPASQSNSYGSKVKLSLKYSKNLNFNNSLATVYINNRNIGSYKLTKDNADNDELTFNIPNNMKIGSGFSVRVAFDLEPSQITKSDNSETPWAAINTNSKIFVKSIEKNDILFSNYPSLFIRNNTYSNLAVVKPRKMTTNDFEALSNIFNLIGIYAKSNTGKIEFYSQQPDDETLKNSNVIVLGTPSQNSMIKNLNDKLYFQYNKKYTSFISNEKLSIEYDYGKTMGTAQLLRSPYNDKRGMLVVTGITSKDVYLASTQINYQKTIVEHGGDTIVVDNDNNIYNYRFKKKSDLDKKVSLKQTIHKNTKLIIYLVIALIFVALLVAAIFMILWKNNLLRRDKNNEKK